MAGKSVFMFVMLILIVGMVMAIVSVFNSGRHFSTGFENQSSTWNIAQTEADRGSWKILSLDYAGTCEDSVISIKLSFNLHEMPYECDIFVDNRLETSLDLKENSCGAECIGEKELKNITTDNVDAYQNHYVEICCDGICNSKFLTATC